MSHENISKSLEDARSNAILALSLDTALHYMMDDGGTFVYPSATNIAFLVKLLSILMSDIL